MKALLRPLMEIAFASILAMSAMTPETHAADSAATPNAVTAIDILLEPDATMLQHSDANNSRLLKRGRSDCLNSHYCLVSQITFGPAPLHRIEGSHARPRALFDPGSPKATWWHFSEHYGLPTRRFTSCGRPGLRVTAALMAQQRSWATM